jgi:hypothetical protein
MLFAFGVLNLADLIGKGIMFSTRWCLKMPQNVEYQGSRSLSNFGHLPPPASLSLS